MAGSEINVLARANLTVQGQLIPVFNEATVVLDAEVEILLDRELLVRQNDDGSYDDLGPLVPIPNRPGQGCCGQGR